MRPDDGPPAGAGLVRADLVGTVLFAVTAVAAAAVLEPAFQAPAAVVAGALFLGGCVTFAWGFLVAVERSRTEAVELSSLFFLKESAPPAVRRTLLALVAAQVLVAAVTASVRPYTSLAFGVLAPVWGLGMTTLWSARHGTFPAKDTDARAAPSRRPRVGGASDRPE